MSEKGERKWGRGERLHKQGKTRVLDGEGDASGVKAVLPVAQGGDEKNVVKIFVI